MLLLFTYVIPVIPLTLMFDGTVSCLRTRSVEEIVELLRQTGVDLALWDITHGAEWHTWPFGQLRYFAATQRRECGRDGSEQT